MSDDADDVRRRAARIKGDETRSRSAFQLEQRAERIRDLSDACREILHAMPELKGRYNLEGTTQLFFGLINPWHEESDETGCMIIYGTDDGFEIDGSPVSRDEALDAFKDLLAEILANKLPDLLSKEREKIAIESREYRRFSFGCGAIVLLIAIVLLLSNT